MQLAPYLSDYSARVTPFLDKFFAKKSESFNSLPLAVDVFKRYQTFCHGGKKIRGALVQLGYEIAGGEKATILEASAAFEIIHAFLLIHDDIEDQDSIRRGLPTIHKQYEHLFKDPQIGLSLAINVGDLGAYLANEIILATKFPFNTKTRALAYLSNLLQKVAIGQCLDISYETRPHISQDDVLLVDLYKTAIYTISGPLNFGGLLGNISPKKFAAIEKFGQALGVAFQLRDDELGLFADEKTLGKPIGSDIREGKNTLLRVYAQEKASEQDKKLLASVYGQKNLTRDDIDKVRTITKQTEALKRSQELKQRLAKKARNLVPQITDIPDQVDTLYNLISFITSRDI